MNDDFDHHIFERSQPFGQFAFELFGSDSRLVFSHIVYEIANSLSLRQVDSFVEERAEGELARLGYARAAMNYELKHTTKDDGAAVGTDLNNIFAGVRAWGLEVRDDGFINDFGGNGIDDSAEPSVVRLAYWRAGLRFEDCLGDLEGTRTADSHDSDAASPRWS